MFFTGNLMAWAWVVVMMSWSVFWSTKWAAAMLPVFLVISETLSP